MSTSLLLEMFEVAPPVAQRPGRTRRRSVGATSKRFAHALVVSTISAAVGFGLVLVLAMSAPAAVGYTSLTMLTGSMGPTIAPGAVVIDERIKPLDARPGDILTFIDPAHPDRLLTHRLRSLTVHDPLVHMVTRGDANPTSEHWTIPIDGTIGRVKYSIPLVGYVRSWVHHTNGRNAVLVTLAVIGLWTLLDVWLPAPLSQLLRLHLRRPRREARSAPTSAGTP